MEFNIKYKNDHISCSVKGLWWDGIGNNIQEAIEDFLEVYNRRY